MRSTAGSPPARASLTYMDAFMVIKTVLVYNARSNLVQLSTGSDAHKP